MAQVTSFPSTALQRMVLPSLRCGKSAADLGVMRLSYCIPGTMKKLPQSEVLRYVGYRRPAETVRRHFSDWREQQDPPIPLRCDIPNCRFHTEPLEWNGARIKVVLDHINGVCGDNRTENLQFLCPNCNSQQRTHGGANRGRVEMSSGGYAEKGSDGKRRYTLPAGFGSYAQEGGDAVLSKLQPRNE